MPSLEEIVRAGLIVKGDTLVKANATILDSIRSTAEAGGQADIQPDSSRPLAVVERHPGDGAVGKVCVQKTTGKKFHVRLVAVRKRLIDWDNLAEKFHVDLLRYASGGVFGDGPETTTIETLQEKAGPGEREEVRIEVYEV